MSFAWWVFEKYFSNSQLFFESYNSKIKSTICRFNYKEMWIIWINVFVGHSDNFSLIYIYNFRF